LSTGTVLQGHYDCHETLIANCGTPSASFAYLVVVLGAILFAVYSVRLRQRSRLPEEFKTKKVVVDKEGWETKAADAKKPKQKKPSEDKEGQEKKSGGSSGGG